MCIRAVATGTAGTAMAVPLFDKVANKFERILSLLLDLYYLVACVVYEHRYSHYETLKIPV